MWQGEAKVYQRGKQCKRPCPGELTDDRVEDLSLENMPRNSELSVFKADRGIMVVLDVEAVEAEDGFCRSSSGSGCKMHERKREEKAPSSAAVP